MIWLPCGYTTHLPQDAQGAVGCHHAVKTLPEIPAAEDSLETTPRHHRPLHTGDFVVLFPGDISSYSGTTDRVREVQTLKVPLSGFLAIESL